MTIGVSDDLYHTDTAKGIEVIVSSQKVTSPSQLKCGLVTSCRGAGIT